jgi:Protein of unknown function (DUF642)
MTYLINLRRSLRLNSKNQKTNAMKIPRSTTGLVILFVATASSSAAIILNGSFENPLVTSGSYTNFSAGSTSITGWTVVGVDSALTSGAFLQSGITFQAQSGNQWLDLAGVTSNSNASGVRQDIATDFGQAYELSFYVGSATDGTFFFPTTVDLSINGGSRSSYFNPAAPTTMLDWELFTVPFTATGSITSLTFYNGAAPNNYNSALDNVSVTVVPEPSKTLFGVIGLTGLLFRRFRNGSDG